MMRWWRPFNPSFSILSNLTERSIPRKYICHVALQFSGEQPEKVYTELKSEAIDSQLWNREGGIPWAVLAGLGTSSGGARPSSVPKQTNKQTDTLHSSSLLVSCTWQLLEQLVITRISWWHLYRVTISTHTDSCINCRTKIFTQLRKYYSR